MAYGWLALILLIATAKLSSTSDIKTLSSELFPDWMPIKAKQSSAVEEFLKVETKKLTKRLAGPNNYVFAVAASDSDDYYDKGQGDSEGDDYYEKKEWSDVYRDAHPSKHVSVKLDHPDLSDIEGIGVAGHKKQQHQQKEAKHEAKPTVSTASTKHDEKELAKKNKNEQVKEKKAVKTKKTKKATSKVILRTTTSTTEQDEEPAVTRGSRSWPAPVTVGAFELFG